MARPGIGNSVEGVHAVTAALAAGRVERLTVERSRLESLADSADLGGIDENDPASVARFMKKMGSELGEDLGEDFDSAVDEATEEATTEESGGGNGGDEA